jgi:hypothetical protein
MFFVVVSWLLEMPSFLGQENLENEEAAEAGPWHCRLLF